MKQIIRNINLSLLTYMSDRIDIDEGIKNLAENIKTYGVRHPVLIDHIEETDRFAIIDGRRRFEACKLLSYETIPCILLTKEELKEDLSVILNTHRKDYTPVELYRIATKYVKDELKGDPLLLPPDKIRLVAKKLNFDFNATCRILNIGRLDVTVYKSLMVGFIPLRLALLTIYIRNKAIRDRYCKWCQRERPSTKEAVAWIRSEHEKGNAMRFLYHAIFNTQKCVKCRYRGRRDVSLFEDPLISKDDDYCWNVECFEKKTDEAYNSVLKEARDKLGLKGIKRGKSKHPYYDCRIFKDITRIAPEKCKSCTHVLVGADYSGKIKIFCPPDCSNIKQIQQSKEKPRAKYKDKDKNKYTKKDKIDLLNDRFPLAVRKAMIDYFFQGKIFRKEMIPKDYKRILFFIGYSAGKNPFDIVYDPRMSGNDKKAFHTAIKKFDIETIAKLNTRIAGDHLRNFDYSGVQLSSIDNAIELLYGEKNWCKKHYRNIVEKLSRVSKKYLKEIQPWKPSWVQKGKKKK